MTLKGFIKIAVALIAMVGTQQTVVAQSTYNKQIDTMMYVDLGVKVYNPDSALLQSDDEKALIVSSQAGTMYKVQAFHKAGVNINTQDPNYGKTPMMWAVAAQKKEVFDYLLANGAQTSAIADKDGYTVLYTATEFGQIEVVKALLAQKGANAVSTQDINSSFISAVQSRDKNMVKAYLDTGLDGAVINDAAAKCSAWKMTDMLDYLSLHGARLK